MDDLDLGATIKGFAPGQKVFGRYTLARVLGRGGMGVVWLARDEELGREVAMKFLPEVVAGDRAAIEEMKREVRRAIDLAHPHIVKTNDFVTDGRLAAVSMEYAPGGTVGGARLDQAGQVFSPAQLEPWVRQLASALDYAHGHAEVVHRDLKPNNLMLDAKGRLKVVDFGIAASISESVSRVSKQAGTSGTPVYMSPQQMMGETPAPTDDLYAVGATLFELLTGKPPFHAGNILLQVQNKPAPPVNERRRALGLEPVPDAWQAGIAACLEKDPSARPQSGTDLLHALGLAGSETRRPAPAAPVAPAPASPPAPVPAPAVAAPPDKPPRSSAAWATRASGVVAALVAVVGGVAALALADSSELDEAFALVALWTFLGFVFTWLPLWTLHALYRAATGPAKSAAQREAEREKARERRRQSNKEMRAALAAALPPYLLFAGWLFDRGLRRDEAAVPLFAALVVGWGFAALFYLTMMRVASGLGVRRFWSTVGLTACGGAAFTAFLWWNGLALPSEMMIRNDLPAVLAAATLWAVAGGIYHRLMWGPSEIDRGVLRLGGVFGAVLLLHALYFSFLELPEKVRIVERIVEERRLAEEQRAREEEEKQAAERARVAAGRLQAAYDQVLGTKPTPEAERQWVRRIGESPSWSDADLRRELRASPEGARGGRLLVPQEFPRIGDAISAAVPGNVVVVAPGTYDETLYVGKDVDLVGSGGGRVVVQGPHDRNVLRVFGCTGVVVRGMTFRHTDTADLERRTFVVDLTDSEVVFEDNEVTAGNGDGIGIRGAARTILRRNSVHHNRWDGVSTWENADVEILDNRIASNRSGGISVREPGRSVVLRGNEVTANVGNAIFVSQAAGVVIEANTIRRANPGVTAVWWNTQLTPAPRFGRGNTLDGEPLRTDAPY
jgi:hypothetical protein